MNHGEARRVIRQSGTLADTRASGIADGWDAARHAHAYGGAVAPSRELVAFMADDASSVYHEAFQCGVERYRNGQRQDGAPTNKPDPS